MLPGAPITSFLPLRWGESRAKSDHVVSCARQTAPGTAGHAGSTCSLTIAHSFTSASRTRMNRIGLLEIGAERLRIHEAELFNVFQTILDCSKSL